MLKVGDSAPVFSALNQERKDVSFKDFRGEWLLLYFYPKDFTSGCTTEACEFRDNFEEIKKLVEVVGVSSDSVDSHVKFTKTHSLPFTLLSDTKKEMKKRYGVGGVFASNRVSFLIDPSGKIVKIYSKVDPRKHAHQVIADLEKLRK